MNNNHPRKLVIQIIMVAIGFLYLGRLFYIQVIDDTSSSEVRGKRIDPLRGLIYDRDGDLVVNNVAIFDINVIPKYTVDFDTTKLIKLVDVPIEDIRERIKEMHQYPRTEQTLVRQLPAEQYAAFQEYLHEFPGFSSKMSTARRYPNRTAAHVLGDVGKVSRGDIQRSNNYYNGLDYIGKSGIEKAYEKDLRGIRGKQFLLYDVHNKVKGSYKDGDYDTMPVPGRNLISTLDIDLQNYGEALMQNKLGAIVAIEPATGEVLAFVTSPGFDPNLMVGKDRGKNFVQLRDDTLKPLFNRPTMAPYPPGSTFKPLMSLIGLQEGVIGTHEHIKCIGAEKVPGIVTCHDHERLTGMRHAIELSCNNYYSTLYKRILSNHKVHRNTENAYTKWREYVTSFGIGQKLNKERFIEHKGNIPEAEYFNKLYGQGHWNGATVVSLSVGQGELQLTPLQIANMYAAIGNRGYYIDPHLVKKVDGVDSSKMVPFVKHNIAIEPQHFEVVIDGLEDVVTKGTAKTSRIPSINMVGKTGTAQNPHGEDHSIFAAFAPKKQPKIAICVFVENSGYGSAWAAPIASLMIEKYINDTICTERLGMEQKMLKGNLIE